MKSNDFHHKMNLIGIHCVACRLMFGAFASEWWERADAAPKFRLRREINYTRNATLKFYASRKLPNRKQFILFICVKSYADNVQLVARHPTHAGARARPFHVVWVFVCECDGVPMICFKCRQMNTRHHDQCLHILRQSYAIIKTVSICNN